jgi:hypothetical protein
VRCSHTYQIKIVTPSALGCEDCLRTGSPWVYAALPQLRALGGAVSRQMVDSKGRDNAGLGMSVAATSRPIVRPGNISKRPVIRSLRATTLLRAGLVLYR